MIDLFALTATLPAAAGFLLDLDGTLLLGRDLAPGAKALLDRVGKRGVILSNDSEHVPEQMARRFRRWGMALEASDFILAGASAVDRIADREPGLSIMLLGSDALRQRARHRGLVLDDPVPELVLLARDHRFSYAKLTRAVHALERGARLVLACPDITRPGPRGELLPEVGALAAALLACVGDIPFEVIGKPEPQMFREACRRLGIAPADAVMIGDNPATDGAGASRLGMSFIQIRHQDATPILDAVG